MFSDYNKLRSFVEVAETGSVSQAAKNLFRTQPAITQQLQSLELELGLQLLERKNARIFLTPEGERIYKIANDRLREISEQVHQVVGDTQLLSGSISIGARPDIAQQVLPELICEFRKKYRNVNFVIRHGSAPEIEQMLIHNQVDIGMMLFIEDKSLFEVIPMKWSRLLLVASPAYLASQPNVRKAESVLKLDLIDYSQDNLATHVWAKNAAPSIVAEIKRKQPAVVVDDALMAKKLALADIGATILPEETAREALQNGTLVHVLPSKSPQYGLSFDLVCKKKRSSVLIKERFFEFAKTQLSG